MFPLKTLHRLLNKIAVGLFLLQEAFRTLKNQVFGLIVTTECSVALKTNQLSLCFVHSHEYTS